MLTGSLSGPGGVSIAFQPVGTRRYKGQDSYRASTGTRTGGKDGDTYQCTASNGIPSPDGSIGTSIRGRDYIHSTNFKFPLTNLNNYNIKFNEEQNL